MLFFIFAVFFKVVHTKRAEKIWKFIKYGPKIWRKALFNCLLKTNILCTRKSDFLVPARRFVTNSLLIYLLTTLITALKVVLEKKFSEFGDFWLVDSDEQQPIRSLQQHSNFKKVCQKYDLTSFCNVSPFFLLQDSSAH